MRRLAALAVGAVALAGCEGGAPPYGFAQHATQHFTLEAEHVTRIDDVPVRVQQAAEFRLVGQPLEQGGGTSLELYLDRFYEATEGPDGGSEVGISDAGIVVLDDAHGEARLGPDDRTPTSPSVRELLERPLASVVVEPSGAVSGTAFHSYDPLLAQVTPLEWLLLALPVLGGEQVVWSGSREVPRIGEYRLGVQLPLRYERRAGEGDRPVIRAAGFARRPDIRLRDGFAGELELEYRGETRLDDEARLARATAELSLTFAAHDGGRIESRHRVRIRCARCDDAINSSGQGPDQEAE